MEKEEEDTKKECYLMIERKKKIEAAVLSYNFILHVIWFVLFHLTFSIAISNLVCRCVVADTAYTYIA